MSVRVTDRTAVALYCSSTGIAFGPIFDSAEDADGFLEWLAPKTFVDARSIPAKELLELREAWSMERDGDLSDTARFGAGT